MCCCQVSAPTCTSAGNPKIRRDNTLSISSKCMLRHLDDSLSCTIIIVGWYGALRRWRIPFSCKNLRKLPIVATCLILSHIVRRTLSLQGSLEQLSMTTTNHSRVQHNPHEYAPRVFRPMAIAAAVQFGFGHVGVGKSSSPAPISQYHKLRPPQLT